VHLDELDEVGISGEMIEYFWSRGGLLQGKNEWRVYWMIGRNQ
jgi:hypothetical protein